MNLPQNKTLLRWILIITAFLVVTLILWNTNVFFQKFKLEERSKMQVLATALENMNKADLDVEINLELKIIESNKNIPIIVTDESGKITKWANLDFERGNGNFDNLPTKDRMYLTKQFSIMKGENKPLFISRVTEKGTTTDSVYYRDSDLLKRLQYYPLALVLILFLFGTVIYLVFKSNKVAEQNKLWAGMAKETAHQIGTPLSSLLGWVEILRMENADENTVVEIEKDVERLNTIADRFSKIGSIPKLTRHDVVLETQKAFDYYESRSSKLVDFKLEIYNKKQIYAMINTQLFSWVIENLIKNAIDAMQGKGSIVIQIGSKDDKYIVINVSDTGKGIAKNLFKKIFDPGFTTKRRGWGLGLSLTQRIVQDYHNGRIFVKKSEIGKGTTFTVMLNELL